jgi:hypothetical protein
MKNLVIASLLAIVMLFSIGTANAQNTAIQTVTMTVPAYCMLTLSQPSISIVYPGSEIDVPAGNITMNSNSRFRLSAELEEAMPSGTTLKMRATSLFAAYTLSDEPVPLWDLPVPTGGPRTEPLGDLAFNANGSAAQTIVRHITYTATAY